MPLAPYISPTNLYKKTSSKDILHVHFASTSHLFLPCDLQYLSIYVNYDVEYILRYNNISPLEIII